MSPLEEEDKVLDAMLNAKTPYIDDAGFTSRVMERLPPRRRTVAWLRIAIILSASGFAALVLLLNQPLCAELTRTFAGMSRPSGLSLSTLSLSSMVMVAMLLWAGLTAVERD
jgi:hypothetical protein